MHQIRLGCLGECRGCILDGSGGVVEAAAVGDEMPVPWRRFGGLAMCFWLLVGAAVSAQPLQEKAPAHMAAGVNRATLDSTAGAHYWDVALSPGTFRLVFSNDSPRQIFPAGHEPKVSITLLPNPQGATVTQRRIPGGGTVFEGSVAQRTHVTIVIEPVKTAVREMIDYTLVATGDVDFGGGAER